ncbi:probable receptor-like protein kinase At5g59700 [Rutidosis leptorrhynchoides]|uniref:probable receptor-like protein kinase At5g59700 n=1 Tax=Rutidosis leptorrhynchoides TaxID=125765 RepID=UPI003A99FB03
MESTIRELAHLQIPLENVRKATNNFDNSNIIGEGDFGKVYKGRLLWSGKSLKIAARRLDQKNQRVTEFWREISMLSILKHENIVSIIGFCDEQNENIIINKRCANGSLLMHINKERLTWIQRFSICVGVARALSYMHDDEEERLYSVIHRNVNSSTILLDNNLVPKLSGFEYSLKHVVGQKEQVLLSDTIDTRGYMDPEITKTGGVTLKSDIYSFGIVLWEVLCGRKAFISDEDKDKRFLSSLARSHYEKETLERIIHPDLWNYMSQISLTSFSKAAYFCIKNERVHRPNINSTFRELTEAFRYQESFDSSHLS